MSGHSKWSTIKRQKAANDQARGKLFSKLVRAIAVAVKTGGSSDPQTNAKLRVAIEAARSANMPKENITRAIEKAEKGSEALEEVVYEGFGPQGIYVIVEAATDNRNRTGQEIKSIFERSGGNLGGPGSVSYNFEQLGLLLVEKKLPVNSQILTLIDLNVEDVQETDRGIEVAVRRNELVNVQNSINKAGYNIISSDLLYKPKSMVTIANSVNDKVTNFLDNLYDNDDVQEVYSNASFSF